MFANKLLKNYRLSLLRFW